MLRFKVDAEKAVEAMLYVAEKTSNLYTILKVLYFADRTHLEKYGRFIYGDSYVAMKNGPVPGTAYDIAKDVRENRGYPILQSAKEVFKFENNETLSPLRQANIELLSDSDIECLDKAFEQYGYFPFGKLKNVSHDEAYRSAGPNDTIHLEAIVKTLPDSEVILDYLMNG